MFYPKISVLMINYNHAAHLSLTIESVLSQTYQNIQFIIVDDGSTDCSQTIIKDYASRDPRIEYYFLEKKSTYLSRYQLWFPKSDW